MQLQQHMHCRLLHASMHACGPPSPFFFIKIYTCKHVQSHATLPCRLVQVDLAHRGDASLAAKLPSLVRRLGAAHAAAGQLEDAEVALREVLAHPLPPEERLPVLAQLADVQLREDSTELEAKVQQRLQEARTEATHEGSKVRGASLRRRNACLRFARFLLSQLGCGKVCWVAGILRAAVIAVGPRPRAASNSVAGICYKQCSVSTACQTTLPPLAVCLKITFICSSSVRAVVVYAAV
jgi:hypothetical protein